MGSIGSNLQEVKRRLAHACAGAGRSENSVTLLAVSKTFGADAVREAFDAGQRAFGENYVQEALDKIDALIDLRGSIEWHLIGPLQSNKTRTVAEQFFRAQIEASKVVQRELFAQYEAEHQPPFASVADLNATVRPILDRLTPEMLTALGSALPALQERGGRTVLQTQSRRRALPSQVSRHALDVALASLMAASR